MLTLKMYNKLALLTGFPQYTNAVDTPDITRIRIKISIKQSWFKRENPLF